jgi:putative adhesin
LLKTLVFLFAGTYLAIASEAGTFDRTLPVSGVIDLDIKSNPGGIIVKTGSSASVRVHAVIKPLLGPLDLGISEANIRALEQNPPIEQVGDRIRIGYVTDPASLTGLTIRFEIETPRATQVHAHTSSGAIRIDGIDGPAVTETSSGRTEISSIAGDVTATTHSGSIRIDNVKGTVVVHNSSGSIDALQLAGSIHAETSSGAIRISQINPAPIRALTHSGAIQVDLADNGGYRIDAQSHSGRVSGPAGNGPEYLANNHRLKEQIGAGGPLVDLDTHSSKIRIN